MKLGEASLGWCVGMTLHALWNPGAVIESPGAAMAGCWLGVLLWYGLVLAMKCGTHCIPVFLWRAYRSFRDEHRAEVLR